MGLIADVLDRMLGFIPEQKVAVGSIVPVGQEGVPQMQRESYYRFAREGYGMNELVYACIEELATSAAEPRLAAYAKQGSSLEKLDTHPVIDLLESPAPHLDQFDLISTMIMHLSVSGNAYLEKVRSRAGKVVELWPLRPDRMWVIPDSRTFIRGWEYRIDGRSQLLNPRDVIHFKHRHALDDYYGMPPLAACAMRVDTDNFMRAFTGAFFRNAGVPAGILTVNRQTTPPERELIQNRLRTEVGGPQAWHNVLVLDKLDATFTQMGMALGERGLVLPELDEIDESRIAMVFGVPLQLIGSRLGMQHNTYASYSEARASFWDETLMPLYRMIASKLTHGLVSEFDDIEHLDEIQFDTSTVAALQEDVDAKHTRIREDVKAGLITVQEGRSELGRDADFESDGVLMIPEGLVPLPVEQLTMPRPDPAAEQQAQIERDAQAQQDQQAAAEQQQQNPSGAGSENGALTAAEFDAIMAQAGAS